MKINANFRAFAATNFDPAGYVPSPSYGVNRFMLDRIGNEKARATTIVAYEPNSTFPKHTHIGGEEFLVLDGTFKDQFGEFPAGTYVRNPIGSQHAPWVDEDGCTIMVKLLQMADTGEGTEPLHICLDDDFKSKFGQSTAYGTVASLYRNQHTGEHVEMCWVDANQPLTSTAEGINGGEELFIFDGSLVLNESDDEYQKWGWLRFPVGLADRKRLQAGAHGAQVWRKTGHLTEKALAMEKIQIADDETVQIN